MVVDREGTNMIYAAAGANYDFSPQDVADASGAFERAGPPAAFVSTLEVPNSAVKEALSLAAQNNLISIIDPGAAKVDRSYEEVFEEPVFAITPNEAEARRLTGIEVTGEESAGKAARKLLEHNIENVLITAGEDGAYLVNDDLTRHIPAPDITAGDARDETGCGDQVTATLCTRLLDGEDIETAAEKAVEAGTLQYLREGVQPIT